MPINPDKLNALKAELQAKVVAPAPSPIAPPIAAPAPDTPPSAATASPAIAPTSPAQVNPHTHIDTFKMHEVVLADLYVFLSSVAVQQEQGGVSGRASLENALEQKFSLSPKATKELMDWLANDAKVIDTTGKIYTNVLDAAAKNITHGQKWEFEEMTRTVDQPVAPPQPLAATVTPIIATPSFAPAGPDKKYGLTYGELVDFLKNNAGTTISPTVLRKNFELEDGHAAEIIDDLQQVGLIDSNFSVINKDTIDSHLNERLEPIDPSLAYKFRTPRQTPSVVIPPVSTTTPTGVPSTPSTPPDPASTLTIIPATPDLTLDDILQDPARDVYMGWMLRDAPKDIIPPIELGGRIEYCVMFQLSQGGNREDTINEQIRRIDWSKEVLEKNIAYQKVFSTKSFEADSRFTEEQKEEIRTFLTEADKLQTILRQLIEIDTEVLGRLQMLPDDKFLSQGPTPQAAPTDPEKANMLMRAAAAAKARIDLLLKNIPKEARVGILAALIGAGIGIGAVMYKHNTAPGEKSGAPTAEKKDEAARKAAAPAAAASTPAAPKAEAAPAISSTELNPKYEKSVWWTQLNPEVKPIVERIMKAENAKAYVLPFLDTIEILHETGSITPSQKTKEDLFVNMNQYPNLLNTIAAGNQTDISECIITAQDESTKVTKTCSVQKNLGMVVKEIRAARTQALGGSPYEPFSSGNMTENFNAIKAELIAKANAEAAK